MILKKLIKKKKNNNFYQYYFYTTILLLIFVIIIFYQSITFNYLNNKVKQRLDDFGLLNLKKLPIILYYNISGFFEKKDKIYIDINFKNYSKIEKNRITQLAANNPQEWISVNAKIKLNDEKKIRTKIRYKGDRYVHFFNPKNSSFKLNLKDGEKILGLREFTLSKPRTRNYLHEWIFNQFLGDNHLIKPSHEYVNLFVNGDNLGLYYLEEGFSKEMIERNKKKDSPIFSINEDLTGDINITVPEVYNLKYWKKSNPELLDIGATKLDNFFKGKKNIDEVMDLEKWAMFFALTDLNQTIHGILPKSVKYYFNSITYKFEPIGFDAHYIKRYVNNISNNKYINMKGFEDKRLLIEMYQNPITENDHVINEWLNLFFSNKNFIKLYFLKLETITNEIYLKNFFNNHKTNIKRNLKLIYADYFFVDRVNYYGPGIYFFDENYYYDRAKEIKKKIEFSSLKVFFKKKKNYFEIINQNLNKLIKLKNLKCINQNKIYNISLDSVLLIDSQNGNLVFKIDFFEKYEKCFLLEFENSSKAFSHEIIDINFQTDYYDPINKNYDSNLKKYFNFNKKKISPKKNVVIDENIFIPAKYVVILNPKDEIIISNGAFIFSEAQWIAKGNKVNQITISGKKNNHGGGIFIKNNEINIFDFINFQNLDGFDSYNKNLNFSEKSQKDFAYTLTGAINFYGTNVQIYNSNFLNLKSEDAINIIDSSFKLENVTFQNSFSDAIDIDFSHGILTNINVINSGNDCLDFSGSISQVYNSNFEKCGDKGISAGENSKIHIYDTVINNSYMGIASKDGSEVYANKLKISNSNIGLAGYVKKNSYSHASLILKNSNISNLYREFLKDRFSKIVFNSKIIKKFNEKKIINQIVNQSTNG